MKCFCIEASLCAVRSPSPRRAWIEMMQKRINDLSFIVALPTEGVD